MNSNITLSIIILFLYQASAITKYDFNVCRIDNCAEKQKSCVADQSTCLSAFATLRKCMDTCLTDQQLQTYNICWLDKCKVQSSIDSNTLFGQVATCYEDLCYLNESYTKIGFIFVLLILSFLI